MGAAHLVSEHDDLIGTRKRKVPVKAGMLHKPTPRNAALVRQMARVGIPQRYIAAELGIGTETLRRHYYKILEGAEVIAVSRVLNRIYRDALAGDQWAIDRFLMSKAQRHADIIDEWKPEKIERGEKPEIQPITLQFDAVSAISGLLNQLKRGDPTEPALIEQKDDEDA